MSDFREKVCSAFFQDCLLKEGKTCTVNEILTICSHNELFGSQKTTGIHEVLSHIHSCLGSSKDRSEGLLLLNEVVDQSTTEVFSSHAQTWFRLLIQTLQNHCTPAIHIASCRTLAKIIAHSKTFADLTREITATFIPQLLPLLLNVANEITWNLSKPDTLGTSQDVQFREDPLYHVRPTALACINSCIENYPGPVGQHRNKLDPLVVQVLDTAHVPQEVYRSYALLSQCGGGGSHGVKYTEAWVGQCDKLLGSLISTLDLLYEGREVGAGKTKARPSLPFSPVPSTPDRVTALASRLRVLLECLETLISTEFPFAVKMPVESIVQFISRCLSVNNNMLLSHPTTEHILLSVQLPTIHIAALNVLKRLIYTCKSLLVPYSNIAMSVISQELVWTHTDPVYGQEKPFSKLRSVVYDTLSSWLTALQSSAGCDTEQKVLVQEMLHDCTPQVDSIKMEAPVTNNNNNNTDAPQKKKKGGYQEIALGISSQRKVNRLANSKTVTAALEGLYWLVTTGGSELERKSLQDIQAFTVNTLLSVQQTTGSSGPIGALGQIGSSGPIPYTDSPCRLGLYKLLVACMLTPHSSAPPPLHCAVGILSTGLQDPHTQVSSYCLEAVRISDCLIHPRVPCLNGPIRCQNVIHIGGATSINGEPVLANGENQNQPANIIDSQTKLPNPNAFANFNNIRNENVPIFSKPILSSKEASHVNSNSENTTKKRSYITTVDIDDDDKESNDDRESNAKIVRLDTEENTSESTKYTEIGSDSDTMQTENETFTAIKCINRKDTIELDVQPSTSHTDVEDVTVIEPQPGTSKDETAGDILIVSDDDDDEDNLLVDSSDEDDNVEKIDVDEKDADLKDEGGSNNGKPIEIVNEDSNSNDVSIVEPGEKVVSNTGVDEIVVSEDLEGKGVDDGKESKGPSKDGGVDSEETGTVSDKMSAEKTEVDAILSTFVDAGPDSE